MCGNCNCNCNCGESCDSHEVLSIDMLKNIESITDDNERRVKLTEFIDKTEDEVFIDYIRNSEILNSDAKYILDNLDKF